MELFRLRSRRQSADENAGLPNANRVPSFTLSDPPRPSSRLSTSRVYSPPSSPLPDQSFAASMSIDSSLSSTIAQVLNLPAEAPLDVSPSTVSALASKAKGLQNDNRRLRSEMRDLAAERAEMAMEIERLRSAMRDIVRVAEIIAIPQCGCRSAPSTAPTSPASDSFPQNRDEN